MANSVKESLKENTNEILKNLPEEFHANFKAEMENAAPVPQQSDNELRKIVIEELKNNPNVDGVVCISAFEADMMFNQAIPQPCKEELELEKQDLLSEKMKECSLFSSPN